MATQGIGELFQRETSCSRDSRSGQESPKGKRPAPFTTYESAKTIALPSPGAPSSALHEVLLTRASVRTYSSRSLELERLSYLLWASGGIRGLDQGRHARTYPSAGGLYPVETYLVAHRVTDLEPGVYHYRMKGHLLEQIRTGSVAKELACACLGQLMCSACAAAVVWTAVFERGRHTYGSRAYRYIYLEAGHMAQNLALAAAGLKLGTCQVGALYDDEINALLNLDVEEQGVVYVSTIGYPG